MGAEIDDVLVRHVAKLAHLYLSDDEVTYYRTQLTKIMKHVDELKDLSSQKVPADPNAGVSTLERQDVAVDAAVIEKALVQAPKHIGTAFQVPRIIE